MSKDRADTAPPPSQDAAERREEVPVVLVVDDHAVVRGGCRRMLEPPLGRYRVIEAADGASALDLARREEPAAILLDLNLPGEPNGLALLGVLSAMGSSVVVLSMHEAPQVAARCLEAGAHGYVSKSDDPDSVMRAVESALAGRIWLSHAIATALAADAVAGRSAGGGPTGGRSLPLSPRERQIMDLLARTADLDAVAAALGISYKTVANTLVRLRNRYGVRRTADLVRIAVQQAAPLPPG